MKTFMFFVVLTITHSIFGFIFYHKGREESYEAGRNEGYSIGYRNGYDTGYITAGLVHKDENNNKEPEEITVDYHIGYDPIMMRHTVKEVFRKDGEVIYTREG